MVIKKANIKSNFKINIDIDFGSKEELKIENIVGNINKSFLSFKHKGDLPTATKVKVNVSKKIADGDNLYLYYYSDNANKHELMTDNIKVKDDNVNLK